MEDHDGRRIDEAESAESAEFEDTNGPLADEPPFSFGDARKRLEASEERVKLIVDVAEMSKVLHEFKCEVTRAAFGEGVAVVEERCIRCSQPQGQPHKLPRCISVAAVREIRALLDGCNAQLEPILDASSVAQSG